MSDVESGRPRPLSLKVPAQFQVNLGLREPITCIGVRQGTLPKDPNNLSDMRLAEFLTKLFGSEGGISLSHADT